MRNFKLFSLIIIIIIIMLSACATENPAEVPTFFQQEYQHLYIETEDNKKINYDTQYAKWVSYLEYSDIMLNQSETKYRENIKKLLDNAVSEDINTIYFQARAFGDAYYNSEIFPKGKFLNQDYDPLKIFIDEAHKLGISTHIWINPLRCQTAEEFKSISDDFVLKQWFNEFQGKYICNVDGRMWLNPAYSEVIDLINNGISEIIENYDVDGIHIDDYFYPTTSEDFDSQAFKDSGQANLNLWRIENINKLVISINENIKSYDKNILFGISPQGNITQNYSSQFADVKLWCSDKKYCDYIVPQIYFGFKNETCPFEKTFKEWCDMNENSEVSLIIGLAAYKQGKEDKWAGSGKNEWIEDSNVIEKQQEIIRNNNLGYSIYV